MRSDFIAGAKIINMMRKKTPLPHKDFNLKNTFPAIIKRSSINQMEIPRFQPHGKLNLIDSQEMCLINN